MHHGVNSHIVQLKRMIVTQQTSVIVAVIRESHWFKLTHFAVFKEVFCVFVHGSCAVLTQNRV